MTIWSHIILFIFSILVIWFFAGLVIDAVDRVAVRFKKSGFAVAFFTLGLMTSLGEMSVMINATINGAPAVSAGNLIGASVVILFCITALLAILGNGIDIDSLVTPRGLQILLLVIGLPVLFAADGEIVWQEGVLMVLLYLAMLYYIRKQNTSNHIIEKIEEDVLQTTHPTWVHILKIIVGALCILLAGDILVQESVYFANLLHVPQVYIGILLLSIGTNLPEAIIAVRSILKKHKDIAFGNYLGSSAMNTMNFGILALLNAPFYLDNGNMISTLVIVVVGLVLFYFFAQSQRFISRNEGFVLLGLFIFFVSIQLWRAISLGL